jgi:predicted RNA-binding Zn-ribbon protein involved in translation (DUF1610 family)
VSGDEVDQAFEELLGPHPEEDNPDLQCPKCGSKDIDRSRGYRGEYACKNCGHRWKK